MNRPVRSNIIKKFLAGEVFDHATDHRAQDRNGLIAGKVADLTAHHLEGKGSHQPFFLCAAQRIERLLRPVFGLLAAPEQNLAGSATSGSATIMATWSRRYSRIGPSRPQR